MKRIRSILQTGVIPRIIRYLLSAYRQEIRADAQIPITFFHYETISICAIGQHTTSVIRPITHAIFLFAFDLQLFHCEREIVHQHGDEYTDNSCTYIHLIITHDTPHSGTMTYAVTLRNSSVSIYRKITCGR